MTTPSIPDLIAALEEHDGAMTSGGQYALTRAIAWFGTHRGALAEALRTLKTERDEEARTASLAMQATIVAEQERDEATKRKAESLWALLDEAAELVRIVVQTDGTDGDLLARIDLARGKDGAR